jgi:hypothetical protein
MRTLNNLCSGITLVMASSTAVVIALTWGGAEYAWSSAPVLAPLIVGLVGLALFLLYEARYAKHPLVRPPLSLICFLDLMLLNRYLSP